MSNPPPEASSDRVGWLERDIEALRAREAEYRDRLAHQAELSRRLHDCSEAMRRMLRGRPPLRAQLSSTLLEVARLSSQALQVGRTSIWLFDADRSRLSCTVQLVGENEEPTSGVAIDPATCPGYIRALRESTAVPVEDIDGDPRCSELDAYLRERNIGALLDIPIVVLDELLGVVCHEHLNEPRVWHRAEIEFAASVGSLVALALEAERRLSAQHVAMGTEARYRHLVEALPVTVYAFELASGKLDYLSPRIQELGGWAAEQWLAAGPQRWIEQIHVDDRAPVLARFAAPGSAGFPEEVTYRVRLPDDHQRWVRDTCRVVRDHLGHPIALQGMLCDVTDQVEAELGRSEQERRYRSLLEHGELHAVMLDAQGAITYVNDYFLRVTGFQRAQLIGQNWFEAMIGPTDRERTLAQFRANVTRGAVPPRIEASLRTARGPRRRVLWTNIVLRDTRGEPLGTSSLGLDITERTLLENELLQQTKLESLGRLAAGVAHDFNNLLTVMMAESAELAAHARGGAAREAERTLGVALKQAAELTRSLLLYGHKEAGPRELVEVDALIRDALPLAEAVAGPELRLTLELRADGARTRIDPAQLRQILLNLLGNAADATREHGLGIHVSTHRAWIDDARARSGGEHLVLSVGDDGRGIDARTVAHIFDPFFTTKTGGRRTGLGLALCHSIVSRAGGFIEVDSTPNLGSRFRVHLPLAGAPASRSAEQEPCVLVVDDVAAIRQFVVDQLVGAGYRVLSAEDLASAAQILSTEHVDVLVVDGTLPDGSGQVLARSARRMHPALRVLVMSGSPHDDEGFDAMLLKPFDSAELLRIVAELSG
jgi:two-component system, cell cycle sensor histidine kinase and response regulator CckA